MGEVRPYHHGDLRRHLVAAARAELEEHGVANVVLTRLAQTCGVSVAAPYRHFPSKEALLAEVANGGFTELAAALGEAARDGASPRDRLLDAGVAYVRFAIANPHLFRLMFNTDVRTPVGEESRESRGVLVSLVQECDLAVPVTRAVRASWAMVHGQAALCVGAMGKFEDLTDETIREDLEVLLDGMILAG
ncbi:MAG TPA: TetR/AcrR family transcriptional regulator [Propionibacterium sp.]|nr:TetR/AcrR family transcriptional regulator [Propionibacterium sp.]